MKIFAVLVFCLSAHYVEAQEEAYSVPEITVEGDVPQGNYLDHLPAMTKLSGKQLERKKQSTLGETLSKEPGVSSTFFGPNASRPIIRGLDGDRIRIMENGTGTLDASSASPDHAVSVDPLVVDSIDIVRGPSALLYGSTAIGGVVNVKTKRIADQMIDANELKMVGQLSSVDRGRSLGVLGRGKTARWVLESDLSARGSEDYQTPVKRVVNSSNRGYQEAVGATYVGSEEHAGVALSSLQSRYGTVAEKNVLIDLQRFRLDLEAEKRYHSFIEDVRIKGAGTVYRHQEIDTGKIGTTFRNQGGELRGDFRHQKLGSMQGTFGFQSQMFQFKAQGSEAFLPTTMNQSQALFLFEEWRGGRFKPSAGLRLDYSSVKADNDATFGPELSRGFFAPSASAGIEVQIDPEKTTGLNLTYTERAPNYQEIFAKGVHVATGVYELGNRNQVRERSLGAELFLRQKTTSDEMKAGVFAQSFGSFLALSNTSATFTDPDSGQVLPVASFNSVSALLTGAEFQWNHEIGYDVWGGSMNTELQADFVRGIDRTHSGNLPRIPPIREGLTINYKNHGWNTFGQFQRNEKQGLVAQNETATNSYMLVNFGFDAPFESGYGDFRWTFRVNNVFDAEAHQHTSVLKDLAPLPGRNFIFGVQAAI